MDSLPLWIGMLAAALAAGAGLCLRDRRRSLLALSFAVLLAPILIAADNWNSDRFLDLRDSPATLVVAGLVAAVLVAALAVLVLRWPRLLPLALIAALPFRIPIDVGDTSANLLLPLYAVLAAGLVAAWLDPEKILPRERFGSGLLRWLGPVLGAAVVLYALQAGYADRDGAAVQNLGFFFVPFVALFVLLASQPWDRRLLRDTVLVLAAEGLLFALIGFVQFATGELFWNEKVIDGNEAHAYFRVNSLFFDPNIMGRYLAITLTVLAAVAAWAPTRQQSLRAAAVFVTVLVAMVLTFSQTSMLALIAGLLVLVLAQWGLSRAVLAAAAAAAALALAVFGFGGGGLTAETTGRTGLVSGGLEIAADRPLQGYGSGSFATEFTSRFGAGDGIAVESHTEPVTVAAEQGASGMVLYLAVLIVAGAGLWLAAGAGPRRGPRSARRDPLRRVGGDGRPQHRLRGLPHRSDHLGPAGARRRPPDPGAPARERVGLGMLGYLRRLATTGFAYTAASVFSKIVAVLLLPLYTALIDPAEYGKAEVLFGGVVAASIVVRFGVIEALLRFYYQRSERGEAVVASGFAAIFWATTAGALILLPFAEPIADALKSSPDLVRISIGGLWILTLYEYLVTLFRLDERAKAYFVFSFAHVLAAIPLTLILIAGFDEGARGLLLGSYASGIPFVAWLIISERRRLALVPDRALLRRMLRFGLPTMPAELSLYSLSFVDRVIIVSLIGNAEAGLYALAFKFSQGIQIVVRGFQLAWPPLAYSIENDEEAKRVYAVIVTAFAALCGVIVVGVWLEARWIVRLLAAPEFYDAYKAIGLLTLGAALYGLYLALLVVLGRTGRTEFNLPATLAALIVNIGLNLWLVPDHGIVGAGIALVVAYAVSLLLMLAFTQRLFPVPWQWGRLAVILGSGAVAVAVGEQLPTSGLGGFCGRLLLVLLYPLLLWFAALSSDERGMAMRLARPREVRRRLSELRERAAGASGPGGEALEVEMQDEDLRS